MSRTRLCLFALPLAATIAALACGPMLTTAYLMDPLEVLRAPERWLKFNVRLLKHNPPAPPALTRSVKSTDHWKSPLPSTLEVDVADLKSALVSKHLPAKEREDILSRYRELRQEQLWFWQDHDHFSLPASTKRGLYWGQHEPVTSAWIAEKKWPDAVPEEFRLYAEGADLLYHHSTAEARKSWEALLKLPLRERRQRSIWAAWMLHKTSPTPEDSEKWLNEVCRLSEVEKLPDSLRMHPAALALLRNAKAQPASIESLLIHYQNVKANGRSFYYEYLNDNITGILSSKDDDDLVRAARDPGLRELFTLAICSRTVTTEPMQQPDEEQHSHIVTLERWCSILDKAGATDEPMLGELAISLYQIGRFELARKIIAHGAVTWETQWVWSKLDLQRGDTKSATKHMARALRLFPADQRKDLRSVTESIYDSPYVEEGRPPERDRLVRNSRFLAECATVRLANADFTHALNLFIEADCPHDAAYVIGELLTPDEVLAFARDYQRGKKPQAIIPAREDEDVISILNHWYDERSPKDRLLYVAARRLAREHYFKNAREFFPPLLIPIFDRYVTLYREGFSSVVKSDVRAQCLMEAARLHRWAGMELFGAEGEPDGTRWDGAYDPAPLPLVREALGRGMLYAIDTRDGYWRYGERKPDSPIALLASAEESKRLRQNLLWMKPRYHYRYEAAELAWKAAHLMPKDSNEGALMLGEAGTWLDTRSPQAADRFYKEMVWRFFDTPAARAADQKRWFPDDLRRYPTLRALMQRPLPVESKTASR